MKKLFVVKPLLFFVWEWMYITLTIPVGNIVTSYAIYLLQTSQLYKLEFVFLVQHNSLLQ